MNLQTWYCLLNNTQSFKCSIFCFFTSKITLVFLDILFRHILLWNNYRADCWKTGHITKNNIEISFAWVVKRFYFKIVYNWATFRWFSISIDQNDNNYYFKIDEKNYWKNLNQFQYKSYKTNPTFLLQTYPFSFSFRFSSFKRGEKHWKLSLINIHLYLDKWQSSFNCVKSNVIWMQYRFYRWYNLYIIITIIIKSHHPPFQNVNQKNKFIETYWYEKIVIDRRWWPERRAKEKRRIRR